MTPRVGKWVFHCQEADWFAHGDYDTRAEAIEAGHLVSDKIKVAKIVCVEFGRYGGGAFGLSEVEEL